MVRIDVTANITRRTGQVIFVSDTNIANIGEGYKQQGIEVAFLDTYEVRYASRQLQCNFNFLVT